MNPFKSKKVRQRIIIFNWWLKINSTNNKLLISDVVRSKLQPRKNFDKQYFEDLTNSIKERGVVQPIIVRKSKDISGKYEIIAGERRWLAHRMLAWMKFHQ